MSQKTKSALAKLQLLEERKRELISQRKEELLKIITAAGALTIDDKLLASFLKFAMDPENKHSPLLQNFTREAKTGKIPSDSETFQN